MSTRGGGAQANTARSRAGAAGRAAAGAVGRAPTPSRERNTYDAAMALGHFSEAAVVAARMGDAARFDRAAQAAGTRARQGGGKAASGRAMLTAIAGMRAPEGARAVAVPAPRAPRQPKAPGATGAPRKPPATPEERAAKAAARSEVARVRAEARAAREAIARARAQARAEAQAARAAEAERQRQDAITGRNYPGMKIPPVAKMTSADLMTEFNVRANGFRVGRWNAQRVAKIEAELRRRAEERRAQG